MGEGIGMPRYVKIAEDVAIAIFKGEFKEGQKLSGRSILAGKYNVSPETIRKAMKLLEDKNVVSVNKGSGIIIKSSKMAYNFAENFKEKENIGMLRSTMKRLLKEKKDIEKKIKDVNEKIIDYSYRFKNTGAIEPIEIVISNDANILGKTIGQSEFWHNTGGTIIGVKRQGQVLLSPGPYLEFKEGDKILVIGDEDISTRIDGYLYSK